MTQNMTTDPLGFPIFVLAVAGSSMRSRREHESREDLIALPAFRSGHCSARSLLHPTLQWERAEQKRRYNNLCPLTVPFLP